MMSPSLEFNRLHFTANDLDNQDKERRFLRRLTLFREKKDSSDSFNELRRQVQPKSSSLNKMRTVGSDRLIRKKRTIEDSSSSTPVFNESSSPADEQFVRQIQLDFGEQRAGAGAAGGTEEAQATEDAPGSQRGLIERSFSPVLRIQTSQAQRSWVLKTRLRDLRTYKRCIILPDDSWKVRWDIFFLFIILFSSAITPILVAFALEGIGWQLAESLTDFVFLLDIIFTFRAAFYNAREELIDTPREICCEYLRGWFLIDVLAILPIQLVFETARLSSLGKLARLSRIYKVFKTVKIIRLMKFVKARNEFSRFCNRLFRITVQKERLLIFSLLCMIMVHTLACVWFAVANLSRNIEDTWIYRYEYHDKPILDQYLAAVYFIIATVTTVGYGDFHANTQLEKAFCCILMIIGVVAYTTAISYLSSLISARDRRMARLLQKIDILETIRSDFALSFDLYWRLRQSLQYQTQHDMTDKQSLLSELPEKLRVELTTTMYEDELSKIAFFADRSPQFLAAVAPLLKPMVFERGEYVYLKGDPLDCVYFLRSGEAAYVERKREADLIFAVNKPGSYFGDIDFTLSTHSAEAKRQYTIKAISEIHVLALHKHDLYNIDLNFKTEILALFEKSQLYSARLRKFNAEAREWFITRSRLAQQTPISSESEPLEEIEEEDEQLERLRRDSSKRPNQVKLHKQCRVGSFLKYEEAEECLVQYPPEIRLSRFQKQDTSKQHSINLTDMLEDRSKKFQEIRENIQRDIQRIKIQLNGFLENLHHSQQISRLFTRNEESDLRGRERPSPPDPPEQRRLLSLSVSNDAKGPPQQRARSNEELPTRRRIVWSQDTPQQERRGSNDRDRPPSQL